MRRMHNTKTDIGQYRLVLIIAEWKWLIPELQITFLLFSISPFSQIEKKEKWRIRVTNALVRPLKCAVSTGCEPAYSVIHLEPGPRQLMIVITKCDHHTKYRWKKHCQWLILFPCVSYWYPVVPNTKTWKFWSAKCSAQVCMHRLPNCSIISKLVLWSSTPQKQDLIDLLFLH